MTNKISPKRKSEYRGPRAKKPKIRQLSRNLKKKMAFEDRCTDEIIRMAELRQLWVEQEYERDASNLAPWEDSPVIGFNDHPYINGPTEYDRFTLPPWNEGSEYAKLIVAWMAARDLGAFVFTAHPHPDKLDQWMHRNPGKQLKDVIARDIKKQLDNVGMGNLAYAFIIEGSTKWGRSKTGVHIHGFGVPWEPLDLTRFQVVLENALLGGNLEKPGRKKMVEVKPGYDKEDKLEGRTVWPRYIMKNVRKYDSRILGRRVFGSRDLWRGAKFAWSMVRGEVV